MPGESEFGGVDGLIQPPPHDPTAHERMMLMRRTGQDPENITDQRAPRSSRAWHGQEEE